VDINISSFASTNGWHPKAHGGSNLQVRTLRFKTLRFKALQVCKLQTRTAGYFNGKRAVTLIEKGRPFRVRK